MASRKNEAPETSTGRQALRSQRGEHACGPLARRGPPKLESGEHGAELSVPAACCTLPEGAKAVVVGLQGAAEHNGKSAYVVGMHESGRYNVALSASQQLRLKRANLRA